MAFAPAQKSNGLKMAENNLDTLRAEALRTRIKGIAGGARILWSPEHAAQIRSHVWSLPERKLLEAAEVKPFDSQGSVISAPAKTLTAMDTTALSWQFQISNESSDLTHDVIKLAGWRFSDFCEERASVLLP
jgi:hypothetical protein